MRNKDKKGGNAKEHMKKQEKKEKERERESK